MESHQLSSVETTEAFLKSNGIKFNVGKLLFLFLLFCISSLDCEASSHPNQCWDDRACYSTFCWGILKHEIGQTIIFVWQKEEGKHVPCVRSGWHRGQYESIGEAL